MHSIDLQEIKIDTCDGAVCAQIAGGIDGLGHVLWRKCNQSKRCAVSCLPGNVTGCCTHSSMDVGFLSFRMGNISLTRTDIKTRFHKTAATCSARRFQSNANHIAHRSTVVGLFHLTCAPLFLGAPWRNDGDYFVSDKGARRWILILRKGTAF